MTKTSYIENLQQLVDIPNMASAIRKLATAASASHGTDCFLHASLPLALMRERGVDVRLVVGFAAFRVGDADGDVILHAPTPNMPTQPGGAPYHVWLEYGPPVSQHRVIIDFTTYQLPRKAKEMDLSDGKHTNVEWQPDYLLTPVSGVSTLSSTVQGKTGLFHYARDLSMERRVMEIAEPLDERDLQALRILVANPHMVVVGPNDVTTKGASS